MSTEQSNEKEEEQHWPFQLNWKDVQPILEEELPEIWKQRLELWKSIIQAP